MAREEVVERREEGDNEGRKDREKDKGQSWDKHSTLNFLSGGLVLRI